MDKLAANRHIKPTLSDRVFDIINVIVMLILLVIFVWPLWFVVIASVSNPNEVWMGNVILWPKGFTLLSYEELINYSRHMDRLCKHDILHRRGNRFEPCNDGMRRISAVKAYVYGAQFLHGDADDNDVFWRRTHTHVSGGEQSGAAQYALGDDSAECVFGLQCAGDAHVLQKQHT